MGNVRRADTPSRFIGVHSLGRTRFLGLLYGTVVLRLPWPSLVSIMAMRLLASSPSRVSLWRASPSRMGHYPY